MRHKEESTASYTWNYEDDLSTLDGYGSRFAVLDRNVFRLMTDGVNVTLHGAAQAASVEILRLAGRVRELEAERDRAWDRVIRERDRAGDVKQLAAGFGLAEKARSLEARLTALEAENRRLSVAAGEAEAALSMAHCSCGGGFRCSRCKGLDALRPTQR